MTDVIEDIRENVEKGEEGLKKVVEKVGEEIEKLEGKNKKAKLKSSKVPRKESEKKPGEGGDEESEKTLEEKAKEESTKEDISKKKEELMAKAAALKEKMEKAETEELKEKVKVKKKTDMLVPLDEYVKAGIYLGTRVVTPDMRPYIYRRRADGLAIFNTDIIDEKLKEGIEYLKQFDPEDVILVCKRQAGWRAAEKFGELTGVKVFTKKYPAGILTNKALPDFLENELTIITDQWVDKNALNDTLRVNKNVLMVCDTNNFSKGADKVIIGNNKSPKSIGLIFYLMAREYCKAKKLETLSDIPELEWWTGEKLEKKKKEKAIKAEAGKAE